jgi:ABC-type multidrug transport system ATPase subunit
MVDTNPLWQLDRVHQPGQPHPRLDRVSLTIGPETTAVVGPSGAGKTSLLNLLVGYEKPASGRITFTPPAATHARVRAPLYWVPQNAGLWPHLRVADHVRTVRPDASDAEILDRLAAFDLVDRARAFPATLAQGERMRLAVARALAADPAVLVMDEPLAHVDPAREPRYWDVIRDHLARAHTSLVFATHAPRRVLAEATRAICLQDGRLLYTGDVRSLYDRPATPELAACLGDGNGFTPEEARIWLGKTDGEPCFFRPERMALETDLAGPHRVIASHFQGVVVETELEHLATGATRRITHTPSPASWSPGDRVTLTATLIPPAGP